ncbi:hypothetical protein NDA13_001665 [Ustilago tritici]|nr:hypothetical protein NDA13_001665 [Ustilago tritici]
MSGPSGKNLRLSFKGDKPKKRKRSGEKYSNGEASSSSQKRKAGRDVTSDVEDVGGDEQAWVAVESELDLTGPCFIFRKALRELTAPFYCVAFQPSLQSVEAATILPGSDAITTDEDRVTLLASNPKFAEELEDAEIVPSAESSGIDTATITPQSVYQVWVATKVPGSSSPAHFTFKSAEGKFLGADKIGSLQTSMAARGPQEEWTLERSLDASGQVKWSLRSVHNRYLALDQVAGGKTVVRADADSAQDETAQWALRVQWKHRHAARHLAQSTGSYRSKANDPTVVALNARDQVLAQELETFRSRAGSQYLPSDYASSLSKEERRALRKAQKQGRLAEEMLDRRSKMKSDKYA